VSESPRPPTAGPGRSSARQRLIVGLAIVVFVLAAAYLGLVIVSRIDDLFFPGNGLNISGPPLPFVKQSDDGGSDITSRINFLVLGMDRRPDEGNAPSRSDTIFVFTVDPRSKSARMLGIPRDWLVEIPTKNGGTITDRINTAFITGEMTGYKGGGPKLAEDTIEKNLGISIDHYIVIDFPAFETLIDALGGIEVDVPTALQDPYYSETEAPGDYFPLDFQPGRQKMDGKHALGYARSRNTSSDLDRIQRQQRIIFAVVEKASQLNVLSNAMDLWKKYRDAIQTDVNDFQIPGLARLASQIPRERITALTIGPAMYDYKWGAADVLRADPDTLKMIVDAFLSGETSGLPGQREEGTPVSEGPALVEVQNATGRDGLASQVVHFLAGKGFVEGNLSATNTPDGRARQRSEVLNLTGKSVTARRLAALLGIPEDRVRTPSQGEVVANNPAVDIVVVLGGDADVSVITSGTATPGG